MATKYVHNEISKWKKIDNLIEWKKFQYLHTFNLVYSIISVLIAVISGYILGQSEELKQAFGFQGFLLILIFFSTAIIIFLFLTQKANKVVNEDIEYLLRKKDGQNI